MTIYEQRHVTLSAFSVLSEVIHIAPTSADFCLFFNLKFDINTSKRTMPQQVMDDIFADDDSEYDPDREHLNSQSNETSLQSNKEDEDEADDEAVK